MIALLGPTNTGKTHRAIERMLDFDSGMIGLPLRLLAREVYDKVCKRAGVDAVALVTGEEKIVPKGARYWVSTVEAMPVTRPVEFVAIDEVQLISHHERGYVFTDRVLNARGSKETWLLGSDSARRLLERLTPTARVEQHPRLSRLSFSGRVALSQLQPRSALIAFSLRDVYTLAERVRLARGGAAVVLGALSPRTRNRQVELFQSGEVNYLVATDAIGMGLNLDVAHVAFSALDKFDGRERRALDLWELGQIAGRAGRWLHNGTFGTVGDVELSPSAAKAIELQQFGSLPHAYWRNSALDFTSLEALLTSLKQRPPHHLGLLPVARAEDTEALQWFAAQPALKKRVSSAADVQLLWGVCGIPDFRKLLFESHVDDLQTIFVELHEHGQIRRSWLERRLQPFQDTVGDVDTLVARIAGLRTWAYVAHQSDWVAEAATLQEQTRTLEDQLSEALHQALVGRFVTKQARRAASPRSVVQRSAPALKAIDPHHPFAALSALREQMQPDAPPTTTWQQLAAADDDAFELLPDGHVRWRQDDVVLGQVRAGQSLLQPRVQLTARVVDTADQRVVEHRLQRWLRSTIDQLTASWRALFDSDRAEVRRLGHLLEKGLGRMLLTDLGRFGDSDRAAAQRLGVRFSQTDAHVPLTPPQRATRRLLMSFAEELIGSPGASAARRHAPAARRHPR